MVSEGVQEDMRNRERSGLGRVAWKTSHGIGRCEDGTRLAVFLFLGTGSAQCVLLKRYGVIPSRAVEMLLFLEWKKPLDR